MQCPTVQGSWPLKHQSYSPHLTPEENPQWSGGREPPEPSGHWAAEPQCWITRQLWRDRDADRTSQEDAEAPGDVGARWSAIMAASSPRLPLL